MADVGYFRKEHALKAHILYKGNIYLDYVINGMKLKIEMPQDNKNGQIEEASNNQIMDLQIQY